MVIIAKLFNIINNIIFNLLLIAKYKKKVYFDY